MVLPYLLLVAAQATQQLTQAPTCDGLFFASFNIQNYGVSKASKSEVLSALGLVISRYDLVAIQEISQLPDDTEVCGPHTESAICDLQAAANAAKGAYGLAVSPRIGDEQYGVLYDSRKASFLSGAQYPDPGGVYSRPPYVFRMQLGSSTVAIAQTHTSPSTASVEIAAFPSVITWMEANIEADFYMVAGDYNADGSYFDEDTAWAPILAQIQNYTLFTGNELDTTLALSSNTYDRIIASSSLEASGSAVFKMEDHVNLSGVFTQGCADGYIGSEICNSVQWHEVARELSDHYPIELCMHLNGTCSSCVAATTTSLPRYGADSCALVGFHSDNPDDFAVLFLQDVSGDVYATDRGWEATGSLRAGEGVLRHSGQLRAGDVLRFSDFSSHSGSFSLSSGGDQILVFSGSEAAPDFMCALNFEGNGWQSTADSSSSSALPPGLTHMALAEVDNGAYAGSTSGTVQELLEWIHDSSKWVVDDSSFPTIPTSFQVVTTTTSVSATATTTSYTATTSSLTATSVTVSLTTTASETRTTTTWGNSSSTATSFTGSTTTWVTSTATETASGTSRSTTVSSMSGSTTSSPAGNGSSATSSTSFSMADWNSTSVRSTMDVSNVPALWLFPAWLCLAL